MCGGFFWFVSRRIDLRPEDRPDAEIADGAGEIGFFSPGSYWPFGLALAASIAGLGLVFWQCWLIGVGLRRGHLRRLRPALRVLHRHPAHRRALIRRSRSRPMRSTTKARFLKRGAGLRRACGGPGGGSGGVLAGGLAAMPTVGQPGDRRGERGDHHGGSAADADQLGTVGAVAVDAGRRLEQCHAHADVAVAARGATRASPSLQATRSGVTRGTRQR